MCNDDFSHLMIECNDETSKQSCNEENTKLFCIGEINNVVAMVKFRSKYFFSGVTNKLVFQTLCFQLQIFFSNIIAFSGSQKCFVVKYDLKIENVISEAIAHQ